MDAEPKKRDGYHRSGAPSDPLGPIGVITRLVLHRMSNLLSSVLGNAYLLIGTSHDAGSAIVTRVERDVLSAGDALRQLEAMICDATGAIHTAGVTSLVRSAVLSAVPDPGWRRSVQVAADLHVAWVRERHVSRVVYNLARNAAEAQPGGGAIHVRVGNVMHPRCDDGAKVLHFEVSVRDEGPGIAREQWSRVLEPGYSTRPGANGLGLSVCRALARHFDGALILDSSERRGACVRWLVPVVGRS